MTLPPQFLNVSEMMENAFNVSTILPEELITTRNVTPAEVLEAQDNMKVQGIVSKQEFNIVNTVTNYMMYPLCFIGFFFCLFSVIVYSSKTMRSPTSIYLVALNLTELANVVLLIGEETIRFIYGNAYGTLYIPLMYTLYGSWYIGTVMERSTYAISFILSAERLIAVAFPLRSKHFKLIRFPLATLILTIPAILLFHIFIVFKVDIISIPIANNKTRWRMTDSEAYLADATVQDALGHLGKAMFVYATLAGCLICNTMVAMALKRHSINRKVLGGNHETNQAMREKDKRITWSVLGSTCSLVVLHLPTTIVSLLNLSNFGPGLDKRERYLFHSLIRAGRVCELISNCCGFIIYITLSLQFRQTFIQMFWTPFLRVKLSLTALCLHNSEE